MANGCSEFESRPGHIVFVLTEVVYVQTYTVASGAVGGDVVVGRFITVFYYFKYLLLKE